MIKELISTVNVNSDMTMEVFMYSFDNNYKYIDDHHYNISKSELPIKSTGFKYFTEDSSFILNTLFYTAFDVIKRCNFNYFMFITNGVFLYDVRINNQEVRIDNLLGSTLTQVEKDQLNYIISLYQ